MMLDPIVTVDFVAWKAVSLMALVRLSTAASRILQLQLAQGLSDLSQHGRWALSLV